MEISEKVSVNMNIATLASIDLLVDGGYFSNRSDFINQAVREALVQRQSTIDSLVEQNQSAPRKGLSVSWRGQQGQKEPGEGLQGYGVHASGGDGEAEGPFRGGKHWFMGVYGLTRQGVAELLAEGRPVALRGYGLLVIDSNVSEEELFAAVESIEVRGKVKASPAVKTHYGLK